MIEAEEHCLNALHGLTYPGEICVPFAPIENLTGFDRKKVRRHVRALARKGYATYHRGLWTEDGEPAGAGYCITSAGIETVEALGSVCEAFDGGSKSG